MANEITVRSSLQVKNGNLDYRPNSVQFQADQTGAIGPTPGALTVSTAGSPITLSEITTPGMTKIRNIDPTNYVTVGIFDGSTFHEFMELLPGEEYVFRFSRSMTGLSIAANTADAEIVLEVFEA